MDLVEHLVGIGKVLEKRVPITVDKITIEEVNFILDADRVKAYGIDRVPAVVVAYEGAGSTVPGAGKPPGAGSA